MRDKLIEIISATEYRKGSKVGNNFQRGFIEKIADALIAAGVVLVQPVEFPVGHDDPVGAEGTPGVVQEWVSIEDALPEVGKDVLMFYSETGQQIVGGRYEDGDWYSNTDGEWYTDCIAEPTHWMPLPALPKEE